MNEKLSRENKQFYDKNQFLVEVNGVFAKENDKLQSSLDRYLKFRVPKSYRHHEQDESNDDEQSSK